MSSEIESIWNAYNSFFLSHDIERLRKVLVRYDLFSQSIDIPGDIIECGVFKGIGIFQWLKFLVIFDPHSVKKVIGFDFFDNFKESLKDYEKKSAQSFVEEANYDGINPEELMEIAAQMGQEHRLELIKGNAIETVPQYVSDNPGMRISLLHMDFDPYEPTLVALKQFWPLIVRGGLVVLDEYARRGWGESDAVDEFFSDKSINVKKVPNAATPTAFIIKP